ncbi:hypothetical protein Q3G72_024341 [Acer saccharum]|nr:hypothetical protein Q3G72_024341 [Acer saccharum]
MLELRRGGGDRRTRNRDSQKREGTCLKMSRYKTSRFANDENQLDRESKNKREYWKKKSNVACRIEHYQFFQDQTGMEINFENFEGGQCRLRRGPSRNLCLSPPVTDCHVIMLVSN